METLKEIAAWTVILLVIALAFAGCQYGKYVGTKYVYCGGQEPHWSGRLGFVCPE